MSDYEKRDNTGSLFPEEQRLSDNHPSHKGWILIEGTEYKISGWEKTSKSGSQYISIQVDSKQLRSE